MRKPLASLVAGLVLAAATAIPLAAPAQAQTTTHRCSYTYQGQTHQYVADLTAADVQYLASVGVTCTPGTA